ncbi:MAG: gas vesicle protein [Bacteroidota bacterium]
MSEQKMMHAINATNLADILERVLDKGIVIAGDIQIKIADVELLTIKIRLLVASVDKAMEMGINWWQQDSYLTTNQKETIAEKENAVLKRKINRLENANASRRRQEKITTQ